jgi:hypothetical protein
MEFSKSLGLRPMNPMSYKMGRAEGVEPPTSGGQNAGALSDQLHPDGQD